MAALQNMLDVYFHMKNHYRKLKNVKSCVDTNNKRKSAGRAKKPTPKSKQSLYSTLKDGKVRPPTRRNPKESCAISNAHKPTCEKAMRSFDKYKTSSAKIPSPEPNSLVNIEEHEYLQFSLRMIEDIIKNNLYKREDLIRVFRQHYQANKHCLDHDKMVKTIADWCCELNLNVDDNLLRYFNEPTDSNCQTECGRRPKKITLRDPKHTLPTIHSSTLQAYTDEGPESTNSSVIDSCDATSKQQADISSDCHSVPAVQTSNDFEAVKTPQASKVVVDLSETLGPSEATLKSVEGNTEISQKEKVGDSKKLEILHDAASRFMRESDKESESDALLSVSAASNEETYITTYDKSTRKGEMHLVVTHYSVSVEPEQVETKDFCVQAVEADSESDLVVTPTENTTTVTNSCHLRDATTQKSSSDLSQGSTQGDTPTQSKPTLSVGVGSSESNKGQYVLLDYPVYISRQHTENRNAQKDVCNAENGYPCLSLRMPPSGGSCLNQNVIYTMANNKMATADAHNNDYYDLTPQKDMIFRVPQPQPQQESPVQYCPPQPCNYRNVTFFNKAPMPVMKQQQPQHTPSVCNVPPDRHDGPNSPNKHLLKCDMFHRLDRYQKVHDTLSCFYPTVATQVSSMDLAQAAHLEPPRLNFYQLREEQISQYGGSQHRKQLHYPPRGYDPRLDRRSEYRMVLNSSDSLVNSNKSTSRSCASNYNMMPISSPVVSNQKDPMAKAINLDNYRIDVHAKQVDTKVLVDRDVETTRSSEPSRLPSPAKSPGRSAQTNSPVQESEDEVSGISLGAYPSSENARRRILNLRHDIQKYSKDNISSRRAPSETPRRIDVRNNNNVMLPSELSLPKQRRIPVLRQH